MVNARLFCFETSSPHPTPSCLSADDLSARRAAHVAAVSGRTCAMSLSNSQELPNTSLPRPCNRPRDTHTCIHTHARTEHRGFLKQDSSSARLPTFKTCIFHYIIICNAGCGLRTSVKQLHVEVFCFGFFAPLRYHSQHG